MSAKDRSTGSLRLLFGDPWRKLASIGLAILLWQFLDSQITKSKQLDLGLLTVSSSSDIESKSSLLVAVDTTRYSVGGYYDRLSDEPLTAIRLNLSGANHLIDALNENPGFRVTPSVDDTEATMVSVEFTIDNVRAINPRFESLVDDGSMVPESVRIELIRNDEHSVALDPELVQINSPTPGIETRLRMADAEFSTNAVRLVGPADQIKPLESSSAQIFVVDIVTPKSGAAEVQGTLRLVEDPSVDKLSFANPDPITMIIPMTVEFRTFRLDVPYVLDQESLPAELRGKFRKTEVSAEIDIQVSHRLELVLSGMLRDDERQEWIRNYARLWVRLPSDATDGGTFEPEFVIVNQQFTKDLDYRVVDLKPLTVERIE